MATAAGRWRGGLDVLSPVAARIGRQATRALYFELSCFPKPGLVSFADAGGHDDMDARTFVRSIKALRPYFPRIAAQGGEGADFQALAACGREAEAVMLTATGGRNTHRGAVFSLGLLAAAAGALTHAGARATAAGLADAVCGRWGAAILAGRAAADRSHGTRAFRRYGASGARGQAAAGFPLVVEAALPALRQAIRGGAAVETAAVQALFVLMAELDDTNLLHRGGRMGLDLVRREARNFLSGGGVHAAGWRQQAVALHRLYSARKLSPGGAADLLAATLFVWQLEGGSLSPWH